MRIVTEKSIILCVSAKKRRKYLVKVTSRHWTQLNARYLSYTFQPFSLDSQKRQAHRIARRLSMFHSGGGSRSFIFLCAFVAFIYTIAIFFFILYPFSLNTARKMHSQHQQRIIKEVGGKIANN